MRHRRRSRGMSFPRRVAAAALALGVLVAPLTACSGDDGVTTLNFFQFKGEATQDFDAIIKDFEAQHPKIRVVQNQVPDADTVIRTLLVKDKAPDVITLNANGNYGRLAQAGVFADFRSDPVLKTINPSVQEILAALGNKKGEVNGLGYINNANGIIYNADIFAKLGLQPPTTWDELIAVCDKLKAAGITPFAGTLADSWTALPSFNGLGGYAAKDHWFDRLRAEGENVGPKAAESFQKDWTTTVAARQKQLYSYAQEGYRGKTYDDGNAAFAKGEVAMLMQGIWAVNPITQINPKINAGIFPYPTDSAADRRLVSGVDVVVTMGRNTPHRAEAQEFIHYLFQRGVIEKFAASQNMIPSVQDAKLGDNRALKDVEPFFTSGKITGFIDHQIPPSVPLAQIVQEELFTGDVEQGMATLDSEWRKVAARTIPVTGD